jgi:hypothetical protein
MKSCEADRISYQAIEAGLDTFVESHINCLHCIILCNPSLEGPTVGETVSICTQNKCCCMYSVVEFHVVHIHAYVNVD